MENNTIYTPSANLRSQAADLRRRATRSRSSDVPPTAAPTPPLPPATISTTPFPPPSVTSVFSGGTLVDFTPNLPFPPVHNEASNFQARLSRIHSVDESNNGDFLFPHTYAPPPNTSPASSHNNGSGSENSTHLDFDEFSYRSLAWKDCHYCDFELYHEEPPQPSQHVNHICLGYCEHARKREGRTLQGHGSVSLIEYWWFSIERVLFHPHLFVRDLEGVREEIYGKRIKIKGGQTRWLAYLVWIMVLPISVMLGFMGMAIGLPWYLVEDRPWTNYT